MGTQHRWSGYIIAAFSLELMHRFDSWKESDIFITYLSYTFVSVINFCCCKSDSDRSYYYNVYGNGYTLKSLSWVLLYPKMFKAVFYIVRSFLWKSWFSKKVSTSNFCIFWEIRHTYLKKRTRIIEFISIILETKHCKMMVINYNIKAN